MSAPPEKASSTAGRWSGSALFLHVRALLVLALVWHLIAAWLGNAALLPSPVAVAADLWRLMASGEIPSHALTSLTRAAFSFLLAAAIGVPLGIAMGLSTLTHDLLDWLVELLRPISGIAWIPIALFIFGIGNELPIFIMTYVAVFPFLLNAIAGVRAVEPSLIRAARTMGLGRAAIVCQVILPAALPHILTGARISGVLVWVALIAAELVGAPSGLGFAIEWYRQLLMTSKVMAVIAVVSALGFLTDRLLRRLQQRLTPWATGIGVVE